MVGSVGMMDGSLRFSAAASRFVTVVLLGKEGA
jgi:hypothetical protein